MQQILMRPWVENLARHFTPLYLSSPTYNPAKKPYLKLPRKMQLLYQILLKSTTSTKKTPHFFWGDGRKAAEPELIRQPAQRRRKKRQRPDFDAPVFRLSALARVIRTQAAKKKGRKIDVDPAFPPKIRGVSDADLASTSAESTPARRPCVHQFKKVG